MGRIHKLPAAVINQIAAGEVVERPASVVKELLENAVDSGARRIDLAVERGGKDLIRVADDGRGMDADDLPMAFSAHATSKLQSAEDLERISTLGFRGEALAAIAEISRTRCVTRTIDSETALGLEIEGGIQGEIKPAAGPPGTVVEVRDLFYNTPVRRRFLKSDTTEAGHVSEAFQRIVLANPDIHFTYRSGGKTVYDIPARASMRERIGTFFGQDLAEDLIWIDSRVDDYRVFGFVAQPRHSRGSSRSQHFFVGGRYVRDRTLTHALTEAYRGLLMVGRQPVAFLTFEIPPDDLDVNVHPAKTEVRFRDSQKLYALLLSAIRHKFLGTDLHERISAHGRGDAVPVSFPSNDEEAEESPKLAEPAAAAAASADAAPFRLNSAAPSRQSVSNWFQNSPGASDSASFPAKPMNFGVPAGTDRYRQAASPASSATPVSWSMASTSSAPFQADLDTGATSAVDADAAIASTRPGNGVEPERNDSLVSGIAPEVPKTYRKAVQIHDSYLVVETDEGLSLVDQHALHERILFEELKAKIQEGGVESQRLLLPETLELEPADHELALEHEEILTKLGLEVQDYGAPTLAVLSLPTLARHVAAGDLVRDLIDRFRHAQATPEPDAILNLTLATIACKAAVKAGDPLKPEEIEALLAKATHFAHSHHCPHGRPSSLNFSKSELEKRFGRT